MSYEHDGYVGRNCLILDFRIVSISGYMLIGRQTYAIFYPYKCTRITL